MAAIDLSTPHPKWRLDGLKFRIQWRVGLSTLHCISLADPGGGGPMIFFCPKRYFFLIFTLASLAIHLKPCFWLAVHGKPVLFWKGTSGLKFPCFLLCMRTGRAHLSFGRFRYYNVNYRTFRRQ